MKERPILFSAPMVRALMAGTKTQTRRVAKRLQCLCGRDLREHGQVTGACGRFDLNWSIGKGATPCPYGMAGDQIWVREAWRTAKEADHLPPRDLTPAHRIWYEADAPHQPGAGKLRPSMFMPRWASRIPLEIVSVRVERLQDISEADAVAEGIRISSAARRSDTCYGIYECQMPDGKTHFDDSAYALYRVLWEQINGPGSWDANPWVLAVELKMMEGGAS